MTSALVSVLRNQGRLDSGRTLNIQQRPTIGGTVARRVVRIMLKWIVLAWTTEERTDARTDTWMSRRLNARIDFMTDVRTDA